MRKFAFLLLLSSSCALFGYAQSGKRRPVQLEKGAVAVIPFRLYGHHIVIPAMVSGHKDTLHFIFDTGTEVAVLHYGLADTLGVQGRQKAGVTATNNLMIKVNTATLNVLYLDKARLPFLKVYLENIPEFRNGSLKIDGFIGIDVLKAYIVKIDYAHRQLVLYSFGTAIPDIAGLQPIPFQINFRTPVITASIELPNGQSLRGNYHLTTGGDYGILFNWPYTDKHQLNQQLPTLSTDRVQDLVKTYDYVNSTVPALSIFSFRQQKVPISYCKDVNDDSPVMEIAGAIGYHVWKHFSAVIINYPQKELYLQQ
ncbi:aspartyl protease family protein [uncultured Chitinophaga sp.]|jgi:hypothetical protein|uniref:aspartyl protease family protein n=1 Tax=uncultured Chitinophaga sp. TaxID=339340 RepID=UPI00260E625F|nr:aspartyl protease family protein [uncultured Chitinophaga sp.]